MLLYAFIRRPLKPQNKQCNRWKEDRKNAKAFCPTKCTRPGIRHVRNINHVNIRHKTKEPKPLIGFPKGQLVLHEGSIKRNQRFPCRNARTLKQNHPHEHLKKTNHSKNRKKHAINKKYRISFSHIIHKITSFPVLYDQYNKTSQFCKEKPTTQHPANPKQEINSMFKSKTTKEKYNTFLNIIVTQLISGLVGLTLLATPLTEGLGSAQIYALFASLSLIILSYLEFFTLENWREKKDKEEKK